MPSDLDAAIRGRLDAMEIKGPPDRTVRALRAVLDVHVKVQSGGWSCRHDGYRWPCDSVLTIARALGITEEVGRD